MMKDTNREKITHSEEPVKENLSTFSEQSPATSSPDSDSTPSDNQTSATITAKESPQSEIENTPSQPSKKRAGWYDVLLFVLMFLASQFVGAFIAVKLGIMPADSALFESNDFEIVEAAEHTQARFVAISLFLAMMLCFIMLRTFRFIRGWKLKPSSKVPGWASPFRLLCGYLLLWCISIAIEPITSLLPGTQSNIGSGGWLLISTVIIAPFFEEYLFRGYIAGTLQYAYGPIVAWILSSIIFGVAHGQAQVMVSATMSGLVLGFYFLRYRSLILATMLHAMNNLTVCFLHTFDAGDLTLRQLISNDTTYWSIQIICSVICLIAFTRMFFIIKGVKNEKYIS